MSWSKRQVRYLEENDAYVARINRTRLCYYTLKAMLVVSVLATLIFLVPALSTSLIGFLAFRLLVVTILSGLMAMSILALPLWDRLLERLTQGKAISYTFLVLHAALVVDFMLMRALGNIVI